MSFVNINSVSFTYPDGTVAIDNISLSIEKGEKVAIVGQNGAGKTTAVKMMNGLLKPTLGDIIIDGWNTKDYTVAKMSRKVGYVFQNPMDQIFHNNVYDEIEFGPKKIGYSESERKKVGVSDEEYYLMKLTYYLNKIRSNFDRGEVKQAVAEYLNNIANDDVSEEIRNYNLRAEVILYFNVVIMNEEIKEDLLKISNGAKLEDTWIAKKIQKETEKDRDFLSKMVN